MQLKMPLFQFIVFVFSVVLAITKSKKFGCHFDDTSIAGRICTHLRKFTQFPWDIRRKPSYSKNTGPISDVSGKGFYVYVQGSNINRGEKGTITSNLLQECSICLQFSYHMYGSGMGTLNIYVKRSSGYPKKIKIFSLSGDQGNQWHNKNISLSQNGTYQIVFEVIRGHTDFSDIALDEIWFVSGSCSYRATLMSSVAMLSNATGSSRNFSSSCGQKDYRPNRFPRVVGGRVPSPGEWPWQVYLLNQFCGGSLISNNHVLTSAHCLRGISNTSSFKIRLGEHDLTRTEGQENDINIAQNGIAIHPNYDNKTHDYDLAVLKLAVSVTFSSYIKPVCLNSGINMIGKKCFITGWGLLKHGGQTSNVLQEAQVPVITYNKCRQVYKKYALTDRMICAGYAAGGVDTCQGDSGGPLVCEHSDGLWYLSGVTSWGIGCGFKRSYGVYTNVTKLISWITKIMKS